MAQKRIITFSEPDVRVIKDLVVWARRTNLGGRMHSSLNAAFIEGADHQAPEIYLAKINNEEGAIPGIVDGVGTGTPTDWTPSSGTVDVYAIDGDGVLVDAVKEVTAYNFSQASLTNGSWVVAIRDKYGSWVLFDPSRNANRVAYITHESDINTAIPICRLGTIEGFGYVTDTLIKVSENLDGSSPFYADPTLLMGIVFTGQKVEVTLIEGTWYITSSGIDQWLARVTDSFELPGTGSGTGSNVYQSRGAVELPYYGSLAAWSGSQTALVSATTPLDPTAALSINSKVFVVWDDAELTFNALISNCPAYVE